MSTVQPPQFSGTPTTHDQRRPQEGECCTCGRPAVLVYVFTEHGTVREVPYCGIPDGGAR